MHRITRRRFLKKSVRSVMGVHAGMLAPGGRRSLSAASANERIVIGSIGLGGKGRSLQRTFSERPDVEFAYLCDVDASRGAELERGLKSRQARTPKRRPLSAMTKATS